MIPILDLTRQYNEIKVEIDDAIAGVLAAGHFINGPNVEAFERELAEYVGTAHAVGVNSGTDALVLALRALGIGPGDEVVTTPFTFVATTEAIGSVGATPVFADIDPATFGLDPRAVEAVITSRTRAIIPVHLYGLPASMSEIVALARRRGLAVVEDCAQSIGACYKGRRTGSLGTIGCFSFFPSKNLGAYGDGGMVTTSDPLLADRIRKLRAHGASVKYYHDELGYNSRLDELQAAILRVKFAHLEAWTARRQAIAKRYAEALREVDRLALPSAGPPLTTHVYHQFTVRIYTDRDGAARRMKDRGVQTMVYYPVPLHLQRVHASLGLRAGSFPAAERAAQEVLSLPMYPELRDGEIDTVAEAAIASLEGVPA